MESVPVTRQSEESVAQPDEAETVLEEVIDVSLHPDRAHHDELGHTKNGTEQTASPREQPPAPLDVARIDE